MVSLVTYHITDPGWSNTGAALIIENAGGRAGAWFADFFFYVFGYLAYAFPPILGAWAWVVFREGRRIAETDKALVGMRLLGFLFVMCAGAGLLSLHLMSNTHLPFKAGGILGAMMENAFVDTLNPGGATLLMIALCLIGVTLFSGLSWLQLLEGCGTAGLWAAQKVWAALKIALPQVKDSIVNLAARLRERQERKAQARPPQVAAPTPTIKPAAVAAPGAKPAPTIQAAAPVAERAPAPTMAPPRKAKVFKPRVRAENTKLPSLDTLDPIQKTMHIVQSQDKLQLMADNVEARLQEFGVKAKVEGVYPGPVITRFELSLSPGMKVSRISGLAKDLARSLSITSVRVVEVIPGKSFIGLEIPNEHREMVHMREIFSSEAYDSARSPLSLALGVDIAGDPVVVDLAKMPHLLVAGTTGSGKSVGLNAMLLSFLFKASPEEVRLIMVDPKMLELSIYEGIPHLLTPVVTDMKEAANALRWCVAEMDRRYKLMASQGVRNLASFNKKVKEAKAKGEPIQDPLYPADETGNECYLEPLPCIVVVVDEFADMMMVVGKKVESLIARIAQKARAAGIHMILATQRPSVDVITGLIKSNIPTRISFQVSSRVDSRTVLDQQGAEQLLGHGDMLYMPPGTSLPVRVHGAFVADHEVHNVVKHWCEYGEPDYDEEILTGAAVSEFIPGVDSGNPGDSDGGDSEQDAFYDQAVRIVTETRRASISLVQRRLKIGYNRAARLIETMESAGIVSPMESNGSREVLAPPPVSAD
ncbi:MAG: DNA translocase FtsK [marine bacterium B5-7]|nr:MAG: DNA translocase FtsK [marine bacterium B5-7]